MFFISTMFVEGIEWLLYSCPNVQVHTVRHCDIASAPTGPATGGELQTEPPWKALFSYQGLSDMYVCIYIYIDIVRYTYTYIHIYIHMYKYKCVYIYIDLYNIVIMNINIHTQIYIYIQSQYYLVQSLGHWMFVSVYPVRWFRLCAPAQRRWWDQMHHCIQRWMRPWAWPMACWSCLPWELWFIDVPNSHWLINKGICLPP